MFYANGRSIINRILLMVFAPFYSYAKFWLDVEIVSLPNPLNNRTTSSFGFNEFINTRRTGYLETVVMKLTDLANQARLESTTSTNTNTNTGGAVLPNGGGLGGVGGGSSQFVDGLGTEQLPKLIEYISWDETTLMTCVYLLISCVVFYVAAWYFNQVVPSLEGFKRPPHFFLTMGYWTGTSSRKEVMVPGDTLAKEKELSRQTGSVRMHKLSKDYSGTTAVKEFSSVFESGRVYAILGHNG
jgi:hypothetical protein